MRFFRHATQKFSAMFPGTAHCLGGCVIAREPDQGVVNNRHRVFGIETCMSAMGQCWAQISA
jgi:cholesterol oxidase